MRVPWVARRSNQSTLKEINPEYSLKRVMLKLQYFGHVMLKAQSLEKTLFLSCKSFSEPSVLVNPFLGITPLSFSFFFFYDFSFLKENVSIEV